MKLFINFVFPAVVFVLMGIVRLLVTLIVLLAVGATSVVRPVGVDPASLVRSSATKSDENNNKETLSGVKTATTTTTHRPKPEEFLDLAQLITPSLKDDWELDLARREGYLWTLAQNLEMQDLKMQGRADRLKTFDEEKARFEKFRDLVEGRFNEALNPYPILRTSMPSRDVWRTASLSSSSASLSSSRNEGWLSRGTSIASDV